MTPYVCCDERRRDDVLASTLNGIDFVEVTDAAAGPQRALRVHFLKAPAPQGIGPANLRIRGGQRITGIQLDPATPPVYDGDVLVVSVDRAGDFSNYVLSLVESDDSGLALSGLDPLFASTEFAFKTSCPTPFDCQTTAVCVPAPRAQPEFGYLAKDYASFRQLMLDRLSLLVPSWSERNAADLGITLVELLAYIGDQLSYQQDAIATEAYLGTARLRSSVRRHARLVDYFMHEGCAARAWVQVSVSADGVRLPKRTQFLTGVSGARAAIAPGSSALSAALAAGALVFESLAEAQLFVAHASLSFYTWGNRQCCLPAGTTSATLRGQLSNLQVGDVLVLEEVIGPRTGRREDADPSHRQAVRLVRVTRTDARAQPLIDPLYQQPITEIAWAPEDALRFALCVSSRIAQNNLELELTDVSVARGNLVLVDHGRTLAPEDLGEVPAPTLFRRAASGAACADQTPVPVPPRFSPTLARQPLTFAVPFDPGQVTLAAARLARPDPALALPALRVASSASDGGRTSVWRAQRDLLSSEDNATDLVVETDASGTASLRFGDSQHGLRPAPGTRFRASYRIGNGASGNVGREAIAHIVTADSGVTAVRNPLPAAGGTDPEPLDVVKRQAPYAFRTQERAVTADDYARIAERLPMVQQAAASFRWTGSWNTLFVTVDLFGGAPLDPQTKQLIAAHIERFRLTGHDVEIESPNFVPLEISMRVSVLPELIGSMSPCDPRSPHAKKRESVHITPHLGSIQF